MVQSLMCNYLDGLARLATMSREEIAIVKNPDRSYMTEEEQEEEFFSGKKKDILERTTISREKLAQIKETLKDYRGQIVVEGLIRKPEAQFQSVDDGQELRYKTLLIGVDIAADQRALPIFDSLTEKEIADFMSPVGAETGGESLKDGAIPFLTTLSLFPNIKKGDIRTLVYNEQKRRYRCVGVLPQRELFAIPLFVVSVSSMESLNGTTRFTSVGVRSTQSHSQGLAKEIETRLGNEFIVTHWSELLKILNSVFNSINLIITAIVSSLFIMAFLFAISTFDILIKKRKRDLALFLALGMPPRQARKGLLCVSGAIGLTGLLLGAAFAKLFLVTVQYTPLKALIAHMYIENFSLRFDPYILALIILMTFVVTIGSALFSSKRIYKIDPIQDLKR